MLKEVSYQEVFDAQEHFRTIMEASARPTTIKFFKEVEVFPPNQLYKSTAYVALALMNKDVSCAVELSEKAVVEEYLRINTGVNFETPENSNFIICNGDVAVEVIEKANEGDPLYPEEGAFIIMQVMGLSKEPLEDALKITLAGPGIKTQETLYIHGVKKEVLECIWEKNSEYPLGVELILCTEEGAIVSIPRSSKLINN